MLLFLFALSVFGMFVCALCIVIIFLLCFCAWDLGFGVQVSGFDLCVFFARVSLCVFAHVCGGLWECGALCQLAILCLVVKKEVININTNNK